MNLQFEISDQEIEKLDDMLKETGLDSYKDLFNTSLTLFYWAAEQVKQQKIIAAVEEGAQKYIQVNMPALTNITENNKAVSEPVAASA